MNRKGCGCVVVIAVILAIMALLGNSDSCRWDNAHRKDTIEAYQEYLGDSPTGKHRVEATARLASLEAEGAKQESRLHELLAATPFPSTSTESVKSFRAPFYFVDENGTPYKHAYPKSSLDELYMLRGRKATSLGGAKTLAVVRSRYERMGEYYTKEGAILGASSGIVAFRMTMEMCLVDLSNPPRQRVLVAYSEPDKSRKLRSTSGYSLEKEVSSSEYFLFLDILKKLLDK